MDGSVSFGAWGRNLLPYTRASRFERRRTVDWVEKVPPTRIWYAERTGPALASLVGLMTLAARDPGDILGATTRFVQNRTLSQTGCAHAAAATA